MQIMKNPKAIDIRNNNLAQLYKLLHGLIILSKIIASAILFYIYYLLKMA
jgi:hypothetical protein